jgi:PKHD-type hydroxylase
MGGAGDRVRTDLAFTLFLSEPSTYEGGALALDSALGEQEIRLAAGDAILYAAGAVHRVVPVTKGERLAVVGWVQSFVPDGAQREVLFDLANLRARLGAAGPEAGEVLLLDKTISNLLRMWARS